MWNRKVFIRIIEVLLCVACVVVLRVTDDESRRVFHYLRNRSREWSLLNNVTWGTIGAALATATCGGYIIITVGLLIAAATGELRGRKTEIFLLGLGVILFGIVGSLSLASIENVPDDLVDNAAIFGALCLITALVFIADMLMSSPWKKETRKSGQPFPSTDPAKQRVPATLMSEKEKKSPKKEKKPMKMTEIKDTGGIVNDGFEKKDTHEGSEEHDLPEQDHTARQHRTSNERDRNFSHVEQELREYTQNFENGRLRDSQRFREAEALQQSRARDSYENGHSRDSYRLEDPRIVYKVQDIYQRPVDELDTPPFPTNIERRSEHPFSKIINPGIKIMKVERDVDDTIDNLRYSDTSQYDNVPVKMRGQSPGILKRHRDVTFNVPPPPKSYHKGQQTGKDDIEMLEESFDILRTITTGTQTQPRTPSSPTDPGYVRHTASNWPQEHQTKTPGSSPEHTKNH